MDLGPILERHNAFQLDLAAGHAAGRSVWLCLKDCLNLWIFLLLVAVGMFTCSFIGTHITGQ